MIHLDRLVNYSYSLRKQPAASVFRETWANTPTNLLKMNLTYSSVCKAYFMKIFAVAKASLVFIKNRYRSSRSIMFFKIDALENFAIFTGKHLCWSFLLIKLQTQVFSCEYCKIFKSSFFHRTPPVATSADFHVF